MRATSRRLQSIIATLLLLLPTVAEAQDFKQPDETLPGFRANAVYEGRGIENLSIFNGDPQLAVPLGPEYPLSHGLSFQLMATYSSRFWHMYQTQCGKDLNGVPESHGRARVRGLPTLGVGWTLELGTVDPSPTPTGRARYFAPDGAVHEFADSTSPVLQVPVDGSQIRIRKLAGGGYVIHFPDGTTHWLTHYYQRPDPGARWGNTWDFTDVDGSALDRRTTRWGLRLIRDRNEDVVAEVSWDPIKTWQMKSIWMPSSSRKIDFSWTTHTPSGQSVTWDVLGSITFPVLASPASSLTVTMAYHASGKFRRSAFEEYWLSGCEALAPTDVYLPFLTSITQHTDVTSFTYLLDEGQPFPQNGLDVAAGVLTGYRLPTGLQVRFDYQSATVPIPCLFGGISTCMTLDETETNVGEEPQVSFDDRLRRLQGYMDASPAVVSRTETDPTNASLSAATTYERRQFAQPVGPTSPYDSQRDPARVLRRVIVKRPSGNGGTFATRHLFHVLTEPVSAWEGWGEEPVTSGPGLEVERRTYEGSMAAGTPVRSVVSCYERTITEPYATYCGTLDASGAIAEFPSGFWYMQPSREVTWYGAPPTGGSECRDGTATNVACHYVSRNEWDREALEFRTTTVGAPKQGPSAVFLQGNLKWRQTTTVWDPRAGAEHWQPKLYTSRTVEDVYDGGCPFPPCAITTTAQFDGTTGRLLSSTAGDAGASRTKVLSYTGLDPTQEQVSGVGVSGAYQTTRTFQNGLLTTSRRTQPTGIGWFQFHVSRDAALGLVTTSYDPNGLPTSYSWDPLGRLTGIAPPGEHPTTVCYSPWNGSTRGALALVRKGASTSCSTTGTTPGDGSETLEAFLYDGAGRLSREIRLNPTLTMSGSYLAVRTTERNAVGLVTAVSEWTPCGAGTNVATCYSTATVKKTTFESFDVFGRPRLVVLPDGTQVRKGYDDWEWGAAGIHIPSTDTRVGSWTANVAGTGAYETTRKDLFGRTIVVAAPGAAGPPPTPPTPPPLTGEITFYDYDLHDQVSRVRQDRLGYEQVRTFTRNALGFLTSDTQPETGQTIYGSYTALGQPGTTNRGGVTRTSSFDALGRLRVESVDGQTWLENRWDEALDARGASRGYSKGKLTTSIGWNLYPSLNYDAGFYPRGSITESIFYNGPGGRMSSRETTLSNGAVSAVASWTYNAFGLVEWEYSPRLPHLAGQFAVETRYAAGAPIRVTANGQDVAKSVKYDPAGGLAEYTSGNNVRTIVEADPNRMPRPRRIYTSNDAFTTGSMTYDGAGNVLSMGSDLFTYDASSRLLSARYGTTTQSYAYDGWNNLVSRAGVSLPVERTTNRLTGAGYDARGNLTSLNGETYSYDRLDRQARHDAPGANWSYLFDSSNERIVKATPATSSPIPRRHMARVILQAIGEVPRATYAGHFTDVPMNDPERPWIEKFKDLGITKGCGVGLYCPDNPTTRAEMAVFLSMATSPTGDVPASDTVPGVGTYNCVAGGSSVFADVAPDHWACRFIHDIFKKGITAGCEGPPNRRYCPIDLTTNWMMEVFADRAWSGFSFVPPGATYTFRGAEGRVLTEYADSAWSKDYVYLGTRLVGTLDASGWKYHSTDHLGSVRLTMNSAGATVGSDKYWPWGQPVGTGSVGRLAFAGMELDLEATLPRYYDHARSIETGIGRFLSPDPLWGRPEDPLSWNRYAYARNNPLRFVDPDGKDAEDFIIGLGNGIRSNLFPGSQRLSYADADFNRGQRLGDVISLVAGVGGIFGGSAMQGGGAAFAFASGGSGAAAIPVGALVSGYSVTVAGAAGAHLMMSSGEGGGAREPSTQLGKSIQSLKETVASGEGPWQRVTSKSEASTSPVKRYQGATSTEEKWVNRNTGETLYRHTVVKGEKVLHETYRDFSKVGL